MRKATICVGGIVCLGRTCGVDGDDDDGDDDASPAGFGVGHASYKAAFPDAASSGPGGK